ncbi:dihydrodipicolinate synthase family protein [Terrimonas sp. NA20]|uniref:Dihydrodipicolinate synthase family protein n=1 Tax=Terrimonas ginsenosidimutans TaxID=2908004 RepID=A0ABS9KR81_9BACT|nr:dihydrodipicolinate synthase family protein [Terrimonas ginsenosidimutans]MCG2614838.1 dihydrodipicolinate synthase family protein [Terrimonas ginsenosidimutans]
MKPAKEYSGIIVPMVTPLTADNKLDEAAVEKLFELMYANSIDPFILGTTGESASLPLAIKKNYIRKAAEIKKKDSKLYTGISATVFSESVDLATYSFDQGADAVAATLPSYYQLSALQMKDYFLQLADAIKAPLIVYNIPATTHMSIPVEIIDELSHHPHIVAVKDSERNDERLEHSLSLWKNRSDFSYLLGWAARSDKALLNGGDGLIPSTGNFAPEIYSRMLKAAKKGEESVVKQMQQLSDDYGALYQKDKTLGESIWALKVLLQEKGIGEPVVMPPLTSLDKQEANRIIGNLKALQSVSVT